MNNTYGIIYKVTNLINGKCYIGQTIKPIEQRKHEHIWNATNKKYRSYLHNAINKYGIENFKWEILCACSTNDELNKKEIDLIIEQNSYLPNGYNLTFGGGGISGYKHTEETKQKISKKRMGIKFTEETKQKMSKRLIGVPQSPSVVQKRTLKNTGKKRSDDFKKRMSIIATKHSKEIINVALQMRENKITYDEISTILNIPRGTISWWVKKYKEKSI